MLYRRQFVHPEAHSRRFCRNLGKTFGRVAYRKPVELLGANV